MAGKGTEPNHKKKPANNRNAATSRIPLKKDETDMGMKRRRTTEVENREAQWSKSKKKRMRLLKAKRNTGTSESLPLSEVEKASRQTPGEVRIEKVMTKTTNEGDSHTYTGHNESTKTSSSLQKAFQERLSGSRFRILNEELYTNTSFAAFSRFQSNPTLFDEYHEGFRHQVEQWPCNPVSILVKQVKALYQTRKAPDTRKEKKLVIADFGCGDAHLAKQLLDVHDSKSKQCPFVVHSFDLVARGPNAPLITATDVAHTPLITESVDIGIFCLSLMGTNLTDFIREAHRVLKLDGRLHIAEVRSRFENIDGKKKRKNKKDSSAESDDDLQAFIKILDELGFETFHTDRSNKMFLLLELKKNGKTPKPDLEFSAKPCIYKRR